MLKLDGSVIIPKKMSEETNGQENGSVPEVELIIKVRINRDFAAIG